MSAAQQLQATSSDNPFIHADRVGIGYALVDNCSFQQAVDAILAHAVAGGPPAYVITPNAQHVVLLQKEPRLQQIYRKANLVVPDGISLLLAARVFGRAFPERVPGVDLFQAVCERAAEHHLKIFLLGGRVGSAELAAQTLRQRKPNLRVETYCPPFGFEHDPAEYSRVAEIVRAAKPQILFVAFGAPKQEYWIYDQGRKLGANICIGIGGSFEMVGGIVARAPRWVQSIGGEWLYRLCQEPRRMWRRYLIGNLEFLAIVLQQRVRRAIFSLLVTLVKSSSFEPELHDTTVRADAQDILMRVAAARTQAE